VNEASHTGFWSNHAAFQWDLREGKRYIDKLFDQVLCGHWIVFGNVFSNSYQVGTGRAGQDDFVNHVGISARISSIV
jgi:hypothetical protein